MITLPFVARSTLDAVVGERDWLRQELTKANDHRERLERVVAGLPETKRVRREIPAMPQEVRDEIDGYDDPDIRRQLEREAKAEAFRGKRWDEILLRLREQA
jgi:hypothetical protein